MLPIRPTSRFKKDLKRAAKQRRNIKGCSDILVGTPNMLCTQCFET